MQERATDDLTRELMRQPHLDAYIKENQTYFSSDTVTGLLNALYEGKELSKASLARRAGMSEVYLHQVFSGRRKPSRDRLLCLCIGMGATLEETQQLLKQAAYAPLYPKIKRDAMIAHGIAHRADLDEINENLFVENEKTLT